VPPPAHPYLGHIARGDWATIKQRTLKSPVMRAVRTFGPSHLADGFGIACAGVIRLLAPECELTSLRVLGAESSCTGETLLTGPGWAVGQGFDVVNVSLSTTKTDLRDALRDLADRVYFGGTVLVAAAGNRRIELPVAVSSVLSVGSHDLPDPRRVLSPAPGHMCSAFAFAALVIQDWQHHWASPPTARETRIAPQSMTCGRPGKKAKKASVATNPERNAVIPARRRRVLHA